MDTAEIAVGMTVRYPRTGTAGRVDRIEVIDGETFAALDSTGLLYRADTLEPAANPEKRRARKKENLDDIVRRENELSRDLGDAWAQTDGACEGGG